MKKFIFFLSCMFLMISCACTDPILNYSDFSSLLIAWKDVFAQDKTKYYVYFFSEHCYYCQQIKQKMLTCIKNNNTPCYLLVYSDDIPIAEGIEQTIGASSIEELWFGGTPSFLLIEMKVVTKNLLGVQKISDYLPSWDDF